MTGVRTPESGHPLVSHLLVASQFVAIGLCCAPIGPGPRFPPALASCALGAALGAYTLWYNRPGNFSVYPEPMAGATLVTSGPYAFVRHPMYAALLAMMAGAALYNAQWPNALGFAVLLAVVIAKVRIEERELLAKFDDYERYSMRTKRFVPALF